MGQANCIHTRMLNDGQFDEKFLAYSLALNNNIVKNNTKKVITNNNVENCRQKHQISSTMPVIGTNYKRHSPDGARVSPKIVEEQRCQLDTPRHPVNVRRHHSFRQELSHIDDINRSSNSRVLYTSDGRYMRYPQPSPPKPQFKELASNAVYKTSTPVKSVSFIDRSSIYDDSTLRREPSGESSNIYSSPSTLTTTIRDDSTSTCRPTPPYKTPPAYTSAVRRSPSGASFEFSPSPIHDARKAQKSKGNLNIDNSATLRPKSCDKLDILEVISNHSNPESNYEEITSLDKAKEGIKNNHTEPKTSYLDDPNSEALYDRLVADLSKGLDVENSSCSTNGSFVLSARNRASLVCSAGLSDDSILKEALKNAVASLDLTDEKNDSVTCWLQEMRLMTEPECLTALQSKMLSKITSDVNLVNVSNHNTKDMVQIVYSKAVQIIEELTSVVDQLDEAKDWTSIRMHIGAIISQIKKLLHEYHIASQSKLMSSLEKVLSEACLNLVQKMTDDSPRVSILVSLLDKVQCSFRKLIVEMLAQEISGIVSVLEEPGNEHLLRQAVNNISALGMQGSEMCAIITESGGIRGLLAVILEKKYRFLKGQAIRALATICCIPQAINELEKEGGIECLTDILCDITSNEQEKSEAAGVIAQISSPWIEYGQQIQGMTENAEDLVRSLTDLAEKTKSSEVFLLSAAALANITFMDSHACYYLKENETVKTLIRAARFTDKAHSLFAKDQVATVLSNMAAVPEYRVDLLDNGGIVLLLCYLQERPTVVYSKAELAACERVQQKSAIAIARLSSEQDAAESIAKLQGVQRLVRLCQDEKERNCSDSVLIACLAALRKVTSKIGNDILVELNAEELTDMKLLDNFKKYSVSEKEF